MKYIFIFLIFLLVGCGGNSTNNAKKPVDNINHENISVDFSQVESDVKDKISYVGVEQQAILARDNILKFLRMLDNGESILNQTNQNSSLVNSANKNTETSSKNFKEDDAHKLFKGKISGFLYTEAKEINSTVFVIKSIYDNYADIDVGRLNGSTISEVLHDNMYFIEKSITEFGKLHFKSKFQDEYLSGKVILSNSKATSIPSYSSLFQDIVTFDKINDKYFYLKNFRQDYLGSDFSKFQRASGKIYLSDYGYVEIKTVEDFVKENMKQDIVLVTATLDSNKKIIYNTILENKVIGKMEVIGENGKLIITPAFDNRYRVEFKDEVFVVQKGSFIELSNSKPIFVKEELKQDSNSKDMLCLTTVYDPDNDELKEITYQWSINDNVIQDVSSPRLLNNRFNKGDKISILITISDQFNNTSSVTISRYVQ